MFNTLETLPGIGADGVKKLAKLGIARPFELLLHRPLRYQDQTQLTALGDLRAGHEALIEATISANAIHHTSRRSLTLTLSDGQQSIKCRFFHFNTKQLQQWQIGARVRAFGIARQVGDHLEIAHPELTRLPTDTPPPLPDHLTPIYPTTAGLAQPRLQHLIESALAQLDSLTDYLAPLWPQQSWPSLASALKQLHHPTTERSAQQLLAGSHPALQRLAVEELLSHQLAMQQLRQHHCRDDAPALPPTPKLQRQLQQQLPFQLTAAQRRVVGDIEADLQRSTPMQRLVQGDVGSGKTIVAAMAALQALGHGKQCALMAPTEMLAEQHYHTFERWLKALEIEIGWLGGRVKGSQKRALLQRIATGECQMVIGTHALIQQQVEFADLSLIIIDEQHRFGVHQRLALFSKAKAQPHQLVMTATPIPRSLAMTAYGDLDLSVIDELPAGRQAITTAVMSEERREEVLQRIGHTCARGRQAYWICPLIDESEVLQCQSAEKQWQQLQQRLPQLSIGLLHGRLATEQKEQTMAAFRAGQLDLLVATTVVEVGVDVPNATVMVIDNAERLGLAQLHQLRGRVGRGNEQSFCVLLYKPPLGESAQQRLEVMRESRDGFYIAERDLAIRGPGELLGSRQTGLINYRIADLQRDQNWLEPTQQQAARMVAQHHEAISPLIERWLGAEIEQLSQV
ncbi:ATP-dependent DNA helicase RecG [Ectothiorhodospiraceae bacterium BW-2]|nr:ATP-dependent DNA helicase RecG [Ectothiorhodospiraceae bacterium BW-2]